MEQIEQLKSMRDAAKERLEAAIKALEKSPDAKLVNSLTTLIDDLEDSLGLKTAPAKAGKKSKQDDPETDSGAARAVEGKEVEPPEPLAADDAKSDSPKPEEKASSEGSSEMSLEDSLEAELLGSDIGKA